MPEAMKQPEHRPESPAARTNVTAVEGGYQLVLWLIPVLDNLPRRQKFQLGEMTDRPQSCPAQRQQLTPVVTFFVACSAYQFWAGGRFHLKSGIAIPAQLNVSHNRLDTP